MGTRMDQAGTVPVVTQQPRREVRVRDTGGACSLSHCDLRLLGSWWWERALGPKPGSHLAVSSTQETEGDILTYEEVRDEIIT